MLAPGCLAGLIVFALIFLLPLFFTQAMLGALGRLGLPPALAFLTLFAMFLGSAINIPVRRIERETDLTYDPFQMFGLDRVIPRLDGGDWFSPFRQRVRTQTIIAVNVGGCLIPSAIAVYEIFRVAARGPQTLLALIAITALDVAVCYRIARPIPNVGIAMQPFVPPLVAALPSLILVPDFAPPVAFVAGVLGPLIGADLLHLHEMEQLHTGLASIGGAGTFDGIVLSGTFAALLA